MDENQNPSAIPDPPHRRVTFTLEVEGDTLEACRQSLNRAMHRINQGTEEWDETRAECDGRLSVDHDAKAPIGLAFATKMREWSAKLGREVDNDEKAKNGSGAPPPAKKPQKEKPLIPPPIVNRTEDPSVQ